MLFNSFDFLIFFTVVYVLFFITKGTVRHVVLFVSSCIFYAWFIPKYLLILFVTIGIDYYAAIKIEDATELKKKKLQIATSRFEQIYKKNLLEDLMEAPKTNPSNEISQIGLPGQNA